MSLFKKRAKAPTARVREPAQLEQVEPQADAGDVMQDEDEKLSLADLIELRKLRKAHEGIDAKKLSQGDRKKRKRAAPEEQGGLRKGARVEPAEDEETEEGKTAKARRVVRNNNFTQQTNTLDIDKHMMAYIEQNLTVRGRPQDPDDEQTQGPLDPQEALYKLSDRWMLTKQNAPEDGSVTNSMTMLTAIPEVDLGMDARLKNIEETEKAKRLIAEEKQGRKLTDEEAHLVATRFYRPHLKTKSDADIMRDAKLEAMGMQPKDQERRRSGQDRPQMATDEMVMERFKKRMRK
ncbi:hepatocellular carcinoma-associated antigen 59-domain-containing protein [Schizophyllum amplum]|uniref:Hepatocellular carcinoma-associated antigen 59-domain-containing protein n=1 Tax=Schizophyllum amplum TaxID=97359 RepID=A0A550CSZ4_9AGAR|nr:hepatocellular carcinoma-associated antigen 59-domain-containing protein [Auriculariopsis ampla]